MKNTIITISPSNNLFRELGNNTYNFTDLISEFIDNSIAAKKDEEITTISIEIGFSKLLESKSYFKITDNAKGIPRDYLGKALSPAGTSGGTNLNEHGLGMKQAIAALGTLEYLITKTDFDSQAIEINELKFGDITAKFIDVDFKSGTEIKITNISSIVPISPQKYTQNIIPLLGARYRRFLKKDNPKIELSIKVVNIDKNIEDYNWIVHEIAPIYFHSKTRRNEPMIEKKEIKGRNWKARLTFGYAPEEKQYEELGIDSPKHYMPYKVSIGKQGLDIINNDRVIKFHQLSELDLVTTRHNKYNYIRGEIELIFGFTTAITKNNIISDANFSELTKQIKTLLDKENFLNKKTFPDEISEELLRDRLKYHFETRKLHRIDSVQKEYAIEGLGGFVDLLANNEPWELKVGDASGLDVYQLFAYMDMGNFETGYLVANNFKTGAEAAANFIKTKHKKTIMLIKREELPINHPITEEELKKYS